MSEKDKGDVTDVTKKPVVETTTEKTIGELTGVKSEEKPTGETVPLATFLDLKTTSKKEIGELREAVTKLSEQVAKGGNVDDASEELTDLATELGADPAKVAKAIKGIVSKQTAEAIKPFQETEKKNAEREKESTAKATEESNNKAFKAHFEAAMDRMPDYKEIVNEEKIKELSLLPSNSNKTFTQLIEETYGKAITGKRTIATETKPGGGKDPEPIDYDRAHKDTEYFKEIMADPERKAEYNKNSVLKLR